MIVLIDNYDSFTYNLFQMISELSSEEVTVLRNDETDIKSIEALAPSKIVISPGPGRPEEAGITLEVIRHFAGRLPFLGICLGHQAIAAAFGAKIVGAKHICHGKAEYMDLDGRGLFRSVPSPSTFTRYHSLAVDEATLPNCFEVSARSSDGEIMGIRHKEHMIEGVQFHPESVGSAEGRRILGNFLHYHRESFSPKAYISRMLIGEDLSRSEAENIMEDLTNGNMTPSQIAGFLVAMNAKGITPEEIAGCAAVLQRKRTPLVAEGNLLDTCGTGGDEIGTFNISSFAALAAAACGAKVAKHGNRAVSSRSGSADFYQALGIRTGLKPAGAAKVLEETGFSFLFAPTYHSAMRFAATPRRELGIKTIMNLLGPLVNPAAAQYQIIGVFDEAYCEPMAQAAHMLGIKRVMVVYGTDGQDEISVCSPSRIVMMEEDGTMATSTFDPKELGIGPHPLKELIGGDGQENGKLAREILEGKGRTAIRDAVAVNGGAALTVYGISKSIREGTEMVMKALSDGSVKRQLEAVIASSARIAMKEERGDVA